MGVTKVVTVCSVKGGTGKTLIALNLAYRLSEHGWSVGYLDADIDNASFSQFVQIGEQLINITDDVERKFELYDWHGVKVFSISLLIGRDRGVTMDDDRYVRIIEDVLLFGNWEFGKLDALIIDMPAGASTVFREVIRLVSERREGPLKNLGYVGSLIVTQPLMKDSTIRTIRVHKLLGIPILGIVENMASFYCPKCGEVHYLFGEPCGKEIAEKFGVKYYGALPIDPEMSKKVLVGKPFFKGEVYDKIFDEIINDIEFSDVKQPGFVRELVEKISDKARSFAEQLLAHMILYLQKDFDFTPIQIRYGFTGGRVLRFVIADEQWRNELARVAVRLKDGKLKVLKEDVQPDFEAVTTFKTFCRMIMGKAKIGDEIIDYDPETAFLTGQLKLYGKGSTNLAAKVFEAVFNTDVLEKLRKRFGKMLEMFI